MKKILTTLFILGFIHPTFGNEPQVLKIVPQKTYILLSDHKINSLSMTSNGDFGYSLSSDIYNTKSTLTLWAENEAEATIKLGSNDSEETYKIVANFSNEETLTDSFFALDVVTENEEDTPPEQQEAEATQLPEKETLEPTPNEINSEHTNEKTQQTTSTQNAQSAQPEMPPQPENNDDITEALTPEPTAAQEQQTKHPTIFDAEQNEKNNTYTDTPVNFEGNEK